ncbi:MAG: hypothetical protein ABSB42_00545 [Tepidisphaeraceae bacterium]|jgi:hypothetical protein
MEVNLDLVIEKFTGWDLRLIVDGKTVAIRPPNAAIIALAAKLRAGGLSEAEAEAGLREALTGIVEKPGDVANWSSAQLIGAMYALFEESKRCRIKSFAGFGDAVRAVMRPESPAVPRDEVSRRTEKAAAPFDGHEPEKSDSPAMAS